MAIFSVRPEAGSRRVATCSGRAVMPLSSTQLWSKPLAVEQLLVADARMSSPIGLARRKSKGVPATFASSPVGISPASMGV